MLIRSKSSCWYFEAFGLLAEKQGTNWRIFAENMFVSLRFWSILKQVSSSCMYVVQKSNTVINNFLQEKTVQIWIYKHDVSTVSAQ